MQQSTNPSLLDFPVEIKEGLRPYQKSGVDELSAALPIHKRVVFQLSTGGGKSICAAYMTDGYSSKNQKRSTLIVVDSKKLLKQMRKTLHRFYGIVAQVIDAKTQQVSPSKVYIAMVETLKNRIKKPYYQHLLSNVGLIIIDEAHVGNFVKVFPMFADEYFVGLTATPIYADKRRPMKTDWNHIVCCVDIPELLAIGALVQNYTLSPSDIPEDGDYVIKNGKIDDQQQGETRRKAKFVKSTVDHYISEAFGKKAIVYNCNKQHNFDVRDAFIAAGFNAKAVDDDTPESEREKLEEWYAATDGAILCNVGLYTKGFDEPSIECVIVNKKTLSLTLWLQMCGRGGRLHVFPDGRIKEYFIIIDLGGNAATLGDWNWPRDWKFLFNNPPKVKDGVAPVKECPKCEALVPASARICSGITLGLFGPLRCGYEFPLSTTVEIQEFPIVLKLITKNVDLSKMVNSQTFQNASGWTIMKQMAMDIVRIASGQWQGESCPSEVDAELITSECYLKVKELRALIGEVKLNAWAKNTIKRIVREGLKSRFPEFIYEPLPSTTLT